MKTSMFAIATAVAVFAAPATAATFKVTYEAAGVQNSTATFGSVGVETFDDVANNGGGPETFTRTFGNTGITGTYTGVQYAEADQFGGAGGTGKYVYTESNAGYTLNLTSTDARGINYFGLWLSALDAGNQLDFLKNGSVVFSYSSADLAALFAGLPAYNGNPNAAFAGENGQQPYAFINFFDQGGTFDAIHFFESPANGAGFESDNHTVGFYTQDSGTVAAVPEPATWALMLVGFAMVGAAARYRRRATNVTFA